MIDTSALLRDLKRLTTTLEKDIRERIQDLPGLEQALTAEWQAARDASRTAQTLHDFKEEAVTQAAVHWLLMGVFVRFLEDNGLIDKPYLSCAEPERRVLALDRHETYFRAHPGESDREYLLACFREVARLPGMAALFDERHNPLWRLPVSGDGAMALLGFWQKVDPDSGKLVHDFTDPDWNTRFLGDLYQDLSEAAQKRYALLQTPEFVEEFILDRTLEPALGEFGYREVRLIDPTCGSGHFLLGAFRRLLDQWQRNEPARNPRDSVQKALDGVYGVDLNPFAVAIARFRLLIAALRACDERHLSEAPNFRFNLATGDSLLHGPRKQADMFTGAEHYSDTRMAHAYAVEDLDELNRILGQSYHAVAGNPPYITVKDAALNKSYRERYDSCHRQYSLGVPFTERFFDLAFGRANEFAPTDKNESAVGANSFATTKGMNQSHVGANLFAQQGAGYVGMITANSFMKREFGKKLIEQFLPGVDLTHVIDTSGAYIPGHGTPTVILFGRNRAPVASTVRTVMGIKGEPSTPADPAQGLVWSAIVDQVDLAGSESAFVSVADTPRTTFGKHPWSIGGGGAADVKELIETSASGRLEESVDLIGFVCMTRADDVYFTPKHSLLARGIPVSNVVINVGGDCVRDWTIIDPNTTLFPYDDQLQPLPFSQDSRVHQFLWLYRTPLWLRREPNGNHLELGLTWWEWSRFQRERYQIPLSITFAFVATHNHFVLDRGGKVFNRSAPVIKLPADASEDEHLALLGLLNSSVACFWMKQVCHNKGSTVDQRGARQTTMPFEDFYEFTGTKLEEFPLAESAPADLARRLDQLARERAACLPANLIDAASGRMNSPLHSAELGRTNSPSCGAGYGRMNSPLQSEDCRGEFIRPESPLTRTVLDAARTRAESLRGRQIAWQEELDWRCYRLYGLTEQALTHPNPPEIRFGERAFELVLARRMAAGGEETTWFARHGAVPITEPPAHWPADYRQVVEARIALIESDKYIGLIERPEYKRRWAQEPWEKEEQVALRAWLLDRLEDARYWPEPPALTTTNKLADRVRLDAEFMQVAELYAGRSDFDVAGLVAELAASEAVPLLPVLRYTESGLRKRAAWEHTWALQRKEDACRGEFIRPGNDGAIEIAPTRAEGFDIPVPPKYQNKDFQKADYWRLRGGLDVPKERFVGFPHCSRDADGSLVLAWAGWNPLQQATAIASYYLDLKENEGWQAERLTPLLAGIAELVPWIQQWHNDPDPSHGQRMGDYLDGFVDEEAKSLGLTRAALSNWQPPVVVKAGRRKRS